MELINQHEQNIQKLIEINKELGESLKDIIEEKDFTISFGREDNKKTLHIPYEDLSKISDLLNEFLQSKGIKSYITDDSIK